MMNLESLANELLLDLFEYFDAIHLLRAFHGLNPRFDSLLFNHYQTYYLDFRFVSKHDFDIICDNYLPQIDDQTIALRLSNDDDTPQQLELFLSQDNLLAKFTHLKAFSLYYVLSEKTMKTISCELEHLPTLTHLNITQCCLPSGEIDILYFIDRIWSLPKLIYCNLDIYFQEEEYFIAPTIISSSIRYVSIKGLLFDFNEINLLFEHTPYLRSLKAHNNCVTDEIESSSNVSSLIKLNLSFITMNDNAAMDLLRNMLNLRRLTVDIYGTYIDGYQWEQIIRNYLPNLKLFHLKEQNLVSDLGQGDQKLDTLLKTFQSKFWLDERKWFVRCDWNLTDTYSFICLYTLPYAFKEFTIDCLLKSKTTCPDNDNDESYHQVHKLYYNTFPSDDAPPVHLHFFHLRHLTVELPIHDHFWSILSKFNQLSTLDLSLSDNDTATSQLQILLNQTINLRSLTIYSLSSSIIMSFIQNTNISVRRLNLQDNNHWFDDAQCTALINSPLSVQCEMIAINIEKCSNVLSLVNNMINLRALMVRCKDDEWDDSFSLDGNDDFVKWLQECLPSTCIITRDRFSLYNIHFWIR